MAQRGRPRKEIPADRPFRGRPLNMWIKDRETFDLLDLLKRKWYNEGKVEDTYSAVLSYMVRNFGEIAKNPPVNDGSLPLDPEGRKKLSLLADTFRIVGLTDGKSDLEVMRHALDYLYVMFQNEAFLDRFIKSRGRI